MLSQQCGKVVRVLHRNGRMHGYCTDHNFHCNVIKAFNHEYLDPVQLDPVVDLLNLAETSFYFHEFHSIS